MKAAKRFYKGVSTQTADNGYSVLLDGRPLKTPGKRALVTSSQHVAELIAAEWAAQLDDIRPDTMPVTRLVNVAIEQTPDNRGKLISEARRYTGTDLLCYRASEPVRLAQRQSLHWDPVLEWAGRKSISLKTTDGLTAIEQPADSLNKVAEYADQHENLELTLFVHLIAVFGSAILSMAVMERHLSGPEAYNLSRLDNLFQIEQWGEDEEAAAIAAKLEAEVMELCRILEQ